LQALSADFEMPTQARGEERTVISGEVGMGVGGGEGEAAERGGGVERGE